MFPSEGSEASPGGGAVGISVRSAKVGVGELEEHPVNWERIAAKQTRTKRALPHLLVVLGTISRRGLVSIIGVIVCSHLADARQIANLSCYCDSVARKQDTSK